MANWKNHPDTLSQAESILGFVDDYLESLGDIKEFSLVFCPSFVFIEEVGRILKTSHLEHNSELGAQDIALDDKTVVTGEVSGPMLKNLGVRYIIIGHSERRWRLNESEEMVNNKLKTTLRNEMIPIVCIGELSKDGDYRKFLENQVGATFKGLTSNEISRCIIAYEPVWAISTNLGAHPDTPDSVAESISIIKEILTNNYKLATNNHFLYGGSVNSKNVADFIRKDEVDGVLVGGASVDKVEFVNLLQKI